MLKCVLLVPVWFLQLYVYWITRTRLSKNASPNTLTIHSSTLGGITI